MNEPEEKRIDQSIEEALAPFCDASPPESVRSANRAAVRRALSPEPAAPWWRQSIAVPLPAAVAAATLLVAATASALWPRGVETLADPDTAPATLARQPLGGGDPSGQWDWTVSHHYIDSIETLALERNAWTVQRTGEL
ncbi:hypothetical protein Mal64_20910 [Pseudobythopirellula maris]|uniref:Uncharacterized protein n=1 Tax=Pseudobythopirellula maris TaxID=2527991 RepID=A0A5C5ZNB8_9BACT|nr:hypothetical protein [Pseudobythopirellula maris]TWT88606.1 hypothetical protein Mal64_20910 [Pseudobythopirellula maris]